MSFTGVLPKFSLGANSFILPSSYKDRELFLLFFYGMIFDYLRFWGLQWRAADAGRLWLLEGITLYIYTYKTLPDVPTKWISLLHPPFLQDYEIERYVRDCRVHQILEGTNEIMRHIIGKALVSK